MFSFFKKQTPVELSFKERVERFWVWFETEAGRLYATVESKKSLELTDEISAKVGDLGLISWVFGPGEGGIGHSLTVSGEGDFHRQLLTIYWASRAPALEGWTFYPARQPGVVKGTTIRIAGKNFDPMEFWLVPTVNVEDENIDLKVWHPMYASMPEKEQGIVLFLFLDEALGEYGTQNWIGEISFDATGLGEAIPITELKEYLEEVRKANDWEKLPPGESILLYNLPEPHGRFRRGDVISISTMNPALLHDYLNAEGKLEDPLKGTGADYVYVAIDRKALPRGEEVGKRGEFEDVLDKELRAAQSGQLIGGAMGTENAYVDLLIFDGAKSVALLRSALGNLGLAAGTSINYFAKEKVGWRVVL